MNQSNKQTILFAVGVNHKTAPIEVREKMFVHSGELAALLAKLRETLSEVVILSTCNRTEIYGVTTRIDLELDYYKDLLIEFKGAENVVRRTDFFGLVSCAACQQLFSVATGVSSKIVGDTQILNQLRGAYTAAQNHQTTGKILNQLMQRGFKVGKQARTETRLHKGAVSASLAAVELAAETFGSLSDKTVLIIGAGETAQMTAECLIQRKVGKLLITNRTESNAAELLDRLRKSNNFDGSMIDFDTFRNRLNEIDIVISSTGATEPILHKSDFAAQNNKILLVDIAVPRDITPETGECANVILKNIDDLNQIVDRNRERRMIDLPKVKRIIANEMADFLVWYYSLPLLPDSLQSGVKPNRAMQSEIVEVKRFLLRNVSHVHKLAMQNGAENFAGHVAVINELAALKNVESVREVVKN